MLYTRYHNFDPPGPRVYEKIPTVPPQSRVWVKLWERIVCHAAPP